MKILFHPFSAIVRYGLWIYYKNKFKKFGKNSTITSIMYLFGEKNIEIEDNVSIHNMVWLQALPLTNHRFCQLSIGKGTTIGDFNHIVATQEVIIGEDVLTANHVYISDNLHDYSDISIPIKYQKITQLKTVLIGSGAWIGENSCIIGASVGSHSVIGANSVVTHDVPDFCVAVGTPAYIIKRYNFITKKWEKTDKKGNFLADKKNEEIIS